MERFGGIAVVLILLAVLGSIIFYSVRGTQEVARINHPTSVAMQVGEERGWNALHSTSPTIMYDATSGIWKMWYVGNGVVDRSGIGYATSTDGVNWNKVTTTDPLFAPELEWEKGGIRSATVLYDAGQYKMWYSANSFGSPDQRRIGYATSDDGITWRKNGGAVLSGSADWNSYSIDTPTVVRADDMYHMWFSAIAEAEGASVIGHAQSRDGLNWSIDESPILMNRGEWDAYSIDSPHVRYQNGLYEMWFIGKDSEKDRGAIGRAFSDNGMGWAEESLNPIISRSNQSIAEPFYGKVNDVYIAWFNATVDSDSSEIVYSYWPIFGEVQDFVFPATHPGRF